MENVEKNSTQLGYSDLQTNNVEKLNIILYLSSKTISLLGTNIYNFALSLYILKLTGSGASFAINVLIGMLPRIILGPFAGILADRVNRKKLTVTFDVISGLIVFSLLGLFQVYGILQVWLIYCTGFILSTINVFYDTSMNSSLPNFVTDQKLMKINSYTSVSTSISAMISPILGGIIYSFVPINLFLLINGVSFIFSSILELFIKFDFNKQLKINHKEPVTIKIIVSELNEVFDFVKKQKVMSFLLKYVLMINLFLSASISVVYPYIINKVLKLSSTQFGIFQGSYFIGMIACSVIIGNRKEQKQKVKSLAIELALLGLILILVGMPTISYNFYHLKALLTLYNIVLLFIMGAILMIINTPIIVAMQRLTPENLRGRITGVLGTLTGGIAPIGVVLAGILIDKISPFIILAVSGMSIIIAAAFMFKSKFTHLF